MRAARNRVIVHTCPCALAFRRPACRHAAPPSRLIREDKVEQKAEADGL
jgi:hypothetical protein